MVTFQEEELKGAVVLIFANKQVGLVIFLLIISIIMVFVSLNPSQKHAAFILFPFLLLFPFIYSSHFWVIIGGWMPSAVGCGCFYNTSRWLRCMDWGFSFYFSILIQPIFIVNLNHIFVQVGLLRFAVFYPNNFHP